MKRCALLIGVLVPLTASGQDSRPTPQTRQTLPQESPLPSIRLPEFVITGRESIDLPETEKAAASVLLSGTPAPRPAQPSMVRATAAPRDDRSEVASGREDDARIGTVSLGLGSYSTFEAAAHATGMVDETHVAGGARYSRTSGFAPWTNGSAFAGDGSLKFPTTLLSNVVRAPVLQFSGEGASQSYRWYGTVRPDAQRTTSLVGGVASLSGLVAGQVPAQLRIGVRGMGIVDSSTAVRQTQFLMRGEGEGSLFGFDTGFWGEIQSGGTTGGAGGTIGRFGVGGEMQSELAANISASVSLELLRLVGQAGQAKTVILPGIRVSFGFADRHRFIGRFAPGVVTRDLFSFTSDVPFIEASTPLRHSVSTTRGGIGIESDWSNDVRSAIELEASRISDHPILADTGSMGVIRAFYGDVTETLVRASAVAKLFSNHYFSAIAIIRSSNVSTSGASLPNIPSAEVRLGHRVELGERMRVESKVQVISSRETVLGGPSATAAGYVRADVKWSYVLFGSFELSAGFRNLFDSDIEYWKGYREAPFSILIGASYGL